MDSTILLKYQSTGQGLQNLPYKLSELEELFAHLSAAEDRQCKQDGESTNSKFSVSLQFSLLSPEAHGDHAGAYR